MGNSRAHKEERTSPRSSYADTAKLMQRMTTDIIQQSPTLNKAAEAVGKAASKWDSRYERADKRQATKEKKKKVAAAKGSY